MNDIIDNIIKFPGNPKSKITQHLSEEEICDNIENLRFIHIQESIDAVLPMLFNSLSVLGFYPNIDSDPSLYKDGCLIVESIRSFLLKCYSLGHPLQIISTSFFDEDDEGNLKLTDNLSIIINKNADNSN
jgi:hypothetical protein